MLNNKGFAVSIILYSISTVVIVVLLLILAVDASNAHNTSDLSNKVKEELSGLQASNCQYNPGDVVGTYSYTGATDEFVAPCKGTYKLEVWGAQGGSLTDYIGGYGGYSKGNSALDVSDKLYVNVGGTGEGATTGGQSLTGGYNGGGNVTGVIEINHITASGGGATSIAKAPGLLSSLSSNRESILIVAGGGGGARDQGNHEEAARWGNGGSGGGASGVGASSSNGSIIDFTTISECAGTQTTGNAFGNGGDCTGNSAGGGGYFGGFGGVSSSCPYSGSGSGGSGYIGNSLLTDKVMYCYGCTKSDDVNTKTIPTPDVSEDAVSNNAKIGNGYAKITLVFF